MNFDPTCTEFVHNPYPTYDRLRLEDPVHWNPKGFWFVSRYADVHACLNDPRLGNQPAPFALVHARNRDKFMAADVANNLIAFKDAPEHAPLRGYIARHFTAHQMRHAPALEPLARACVRSIADRQKADVVAELAVPFASRTICRVIGLPEEDAGRIGHWSEVFFQLFHAIPDATTFDRLNSSLAEFRKYMLAQMADRKTAPRDDLISQVATQASSCIRTKEIADNLMLLAADGVGNVQSGIANCLYVLLSQQKLPAQVQASAKERGQVVDECLRLESPGQYQGRIARETLEVGGREIRAHSIVLLGLASANRDPAAFEAPQHFRADRRRPQHLAFGSGVHMCLGSVLVRKEISALLAAIFDGSLSLELADSQPVWQARPGHRWLQRLLINISPGAQA